jgi:hypothetical protein
VPWLAFILATVIADIWVQFRSVSYTGLVSSVPTLLAFVALPSALPVIAARPGWPRFLVLLVMTVLAATVGTLVMVTDDAQAGVAVLLVPFVAAPFAVAIAIFRWLVGRVTSQMR